MHMTSFAFSAPDVEVDARDTEVDAPDVLGNDDCDEVALTQVERHTQRQSFHFHC